jgi:hypothetical protein
MRPIMSKRPRFCDVKLPSGEWLPGTILGGEADADGSVTVEVIFHDGSRMEMQIAPEAIGEFSHIVTGAEAL